jgi:hypothetical protein
LCFGIDGFNAAIECVVFVLGGVALGIGLGEDIPDGIVLGVGIQRLGT